MQRLSYFLDENPVFEIRCETVSIALIPTKAGKILTKGPRTVEKVEPLYLFRCNVPAGDIEQALAEMAEELGAQTLPRPVALWNTQLACCSKLVSQTLDYVVEIPEGINHDQLGKLIPSDPMGPRFLEVVESGQIVQILVSAVPFRLGTYRGYMEGDSECSIYPKGTIPSIRLAL